MIELNGVALTVGGRTLLQGVDGGIAAGEFVAILGRNGAGKTTLLRAIAGLHRTASGAILIDGRQSDALHPLERAKRIAFVTGDEVFLEALLVRDVVAIGRFAHHRWWQWQAAADDERAVARALAAVRIEGLATRLFSTLSAGERQRVWIALGLAQETPILLLDEPTSHLDVAVAHEILSLLRRLAREGKNIVCALHDVNEAMEYADRIALLGGGRLLSISRPAELLDGRLLQETYGVAFTRRSALLPPLDVPYI
ncbi:MAG TPA: ABC transporter ATP-binding protein [Candidatus Cybelea sp.]|jgi:iron complex transport system ATP-binding protein